MRRKVLLVLLVGSYTNAQAEVFNITCVYDDANSKSTFFIAVDSATKTGSTNYRDHEMKIGLGGGKSKLELLSVQSFDDGLLGLRLSDRNSGAVYRLDYIRAYLPTKSQYKSTDSTVAISSKDGGTSHYSCRSE